MNLTSSKIVKSHRLEIRQSLLYPVSVRFMKLAACMLLLSACYRESADIKVAITSELESFDPQLATSANATKMLPALFDTLTQIEVAVAN